MIVVDIVNLTKQKIPHQSLLLLSQYVANFFKLKGELSIVIASDAKLKTLNRNYRGKNKTTDVLSFPPAMFSSNSLGEIFININDCSKSAKYLEVLDFKASRDYILFFLLIHGLLHLAGYHDEKEKERIEMIDIGKSIMKKIIQKRIVKLKI